MFGSSNPFGQSPSSNPFGTQTQPAFGQANNATSNLFGQPSNSSPFGTQTQPAFGQANSATSNLFGQPSGSSSPFGTQTQPAFGQTNNASPFGAQSSTGMFGGTATGMFGAPQASSPFGASSQGFGSSTTAFGASSAPAFGNSSSTFGGTSTFGQKPFGLSTPQANPFGSNTQQSQPAFGNSTFGASSTPAFGTTNTTAFGTPSTNPFGATSSPAFGTSPTPAFGNSGNAFGNNAFGSGNAFGASSTPAFGAQQSSPAFGVQQSTPAFGAPSTPSFSFGSSPAFGQNNSPFASGSTQSPFGNQGGQTNSGGQQGGSRVMPYASTADTDGSGTKLLSLSAMTVYKDKCHEELRWEDHQRGDKGGQAPASVPNSQSSLFSQPTSFNQPSANTTNPFGNPGATTNPFGNPGATTNPFGNPGATTNPFGNSGATNPFAQKTPTNNTPSFSSPFSQPTNTSPFGTASTNATSVFGPTNTTQPFGTSSNLGFNSSPSLFSSPAPAQGSNSAFNMGGNFNNSQSAPLFNSTPSLAQTGSAFSSPFAQNTTPVFPQPNTFSTPSTGFSNMFSSSSSLTTNTSPFSQPTPGVLQPNQSTQQTQPSGGAFSFNTTQQTQPSGGAFSFSNLGQTQAANTNGLAGGLGTFSQGNFAQTPPLGNSAVVQQNPIANPFGTLPVLPQMSLSQGGNSPSIQYGISSMPVVDKSAPVRVSPLLTSRHLLQRRVKQLPARKYRPGDDSPKVPFFSDEENSNTPKADAFFVPRENPRALFIRPVDKEKSTPSKDRPTPLQENGKTSDEVTTNGDNHESNGETREAPPPVKANQKQNKNGGNSSSPSVAEVESVMPKLHHAEYFTEPRIQELSAKEKVNPGYCGRVKDFVVGRHGYGSIRFLGETDVRKLDLEMLVQFNNREVIVYMDESKKPPVGEGLNKPAEVTLLNIKCVDKKSGKQVKEGPRVEKYKEMLKRKAEEQGAKFVSFDAVNGEWKFRVEHF
ncbi:unnamed protein product [Microthlaspi erraticum]|uniref:Peptidase S59 domain-containing protein n=1 Tax=Microthlaspi erraticum TaxID=1685480 RepID=A0A6D2K5T8_9BRAS|nr:unnamed protein product [Microthlaspi erraticum]